MPLWGLGSCSMDLEPQGTIPDTEALNTVNDYQSFSIGLTAQMRSVTSGDYVVLSDIQLDDFLAIMDNGNRRMEFYNGQVTPSTGEVGAIYSGFYSVIAETNFMIERGMNKLEEKSLTKEDRERLSYYVGMAYFYRAYCYSGLADKFCQSYKNCANRDKEGTGLSLQLVYAPTADSSKYPGRSSLTKTYEQILRDLTAANELMSVIGDNQGNTIPTTDAVSAMFARVYLNMGKDDLAAEYAVNLIKTNRYDLISDQLAFNNMWFKDEGSEIIWKLSADYSHHGSATGDAFWSDKNPDYVPSNDAIYLFDEQDTRWSAWFENGMSENMVAKQKEVKIEGIGSDVMFVFAKYPGNPALQAAGATASNLVNMSKPLHIGEMYVIAAEAYFNLDKKDLAKDYLGRLEKVRKAGTNINSLSDDRLLEEIYKERHRELMGEGLRQADLKRWNRGCKRSDAFEGKNKLIAPNFRNLEYEAGDYRLTWPIPQHEMETNPQLADQQNPGY